MTVIPATGLPNESLTSATSAFAKPVVTSVLWPEPDTTVMVSLVSWAVLVRPKLAVLPAPTAVAPTLKLPATVLAVKISDNWPALLVTPLTVPLPANEPLAPLPGADNVTLTPGTGLPNESVTSATSGLAKAVLTVVLWPAPDATAMVSPVVLAVFVNAKLAELVATVAVAVTV